MSQKCCKTMNSSIMKKIFMGISGLLLCTFLIGHFAGNVLYTVNADLFNIYAHKLVTNPLIYVAEAILIIIFLAHVVTGIRLTIQNYTARSHKYYLKVKTGRGSTFASSTMIYTGVLILAFIVAHLINFKYGAYYGTTVDGEPMRDLHKLVAQFFMIKLNIGWYIGAMVVLGIHVSHGVWSAFQSLGLGHITYTSYLKVIGKIFAVFTVIGFSAFTLYALIQGGY
ncbi:MAG: succinate dehydrogenase cytochrome b subunit [Bacteriovoracaceae bacterium]|nr:succinate dehydrogenase cytochrome b subunit [Bacteriovoracaceae bacterium]